MIEWLLGIGNRYLNKERVSFICMGMLFLIIAPIILMLLGVFGVISSGELSIIGQISQLLLDLGFAVLCLALMIILYENDYKIPSIGYYIVVLSVKGVYQFFITSIGGKGELYTLIFVLCLILHIVVAMQLLNTKFSIFGKTLLYYVVGVVIAAALKTSHADGLSTIVIIVTGAMFVYVFYRHLPHYY